MKKNIIACLSLLLLCQCSSSNPGVEVGNPTIPTLTMTSLTLQAQSAETGNCRILSVESNNPEYVHAGSANLLLELSQPLLLNNDGSYNEIDSALQLFNAGETENLLNPDSSSIFAVTAPAGDDNSQMEISIRGLDNPTTTASYTLIIDPEIIICEDNASNSSQYEISFTITNNPDCPGTSCDSFLVWNEDFETSGTPDNCEIASVLSLNASADYIDNIIFSIDARLALDTAESGVTLTQVDTAKIDLRSDSESIAVESNSNASTQSDGSPVATLILQPRETLSNGQYSLNFEPGALSCSDGSQNQASYQIDFSLQNLE